MSSPDAIVEDTFLQRTAVRSDSSHTHKSSSASTSVLDSQTPTTDADQPTAQEYGLQPISSVSPSNVDALVHILSLRAATGTSATSQYYQELENIMGGIFGRSDADTSGHKTVGVIWKHLTVLSISA